MFCVAAPDGNPKMAPEARWDSVLLLNVALAVLCSSAELNPE